MSFSNDFLSSTPPTIQQVCYSITYAHPKIPHLSFTLVLRDRRWNGFAPSFMLLATTMFESFWSGLLVTVLWLTKLTKSSIVLPHCAIQVSLSWPTVEWRQPPTLWPGKSTQSFGSSNIVLINELQKDHADPLASTEPCPPVWCMGNESWLFRGGNWLLQG